MLLHLCAAHCNKMCRMNKSLLSCPIFRNLSTTLIIAESCQNLTVTDSLLREMIWYNPDSKKLVTLCSCLFQFGLVNVTVAVSSFLGKLYCLWSCRFHPSTVWKPKAVWNKMVNQLAMYLRGPICWKRWLLRTPSFLPVFHSFSRGSPAVALTHGAVRSHPVGVTAAQPGVWYEGPVAVALVWALSPGQLAVEPSPAWLTVALPIHTDAIVGTRRIQAIHCTERYTNVKRKKRSRERKQMRKNQQERERVSH